MTLLYAVAGEPVLHSLSPAMQNAAFDAAGIDARYVRLCSASARAALEDARRLGLSGLNVTAPYKQEMARRVDSLFGEAKRIGAVNTVAFERGKAVGYNTDAGGVVAGLRACGFALRGRRAVVLGSGGAARGAAWGLTRAGASVCVLGRDAAKARAVARDAGCRWGSLEEPELRRELGPAELVVGCAGTAERIVPARLLPRSAVVVDAAYAAPTALLRDAERRGCPVLDGREWLLHQGAEAFEVFTGQAAPVLEMSEAVFGRKPKPRPLASVALVGFMGAGKSTLARALARETGLRLVSVDERVERRAGMSVAEIFAARGQEPFRRLERAELRRAGLEEGCVIDCGGGAVLDPRNVRSLRARSLVVWLGVSPATAVRRAGTGRPLLACPTPVPAAKRLLDQRLAAYASACDALVSTEGRSVRAATDLVIRCMGEVGLT